MAKKLVKDDYVVYGTVIGAKMEKIAGAEIIIWWQHIRDRRRLKSGKTTAKGEYRISFSRPEKAPAKLLIVIEARSPQLKQKLESPALTAVKDLNYNLEAQPADSSEYAELIRKVHPLLNKLDLDDLVENDEYHDISFLAQETGESKEQIVRLTISARLEDAYEISPAVFFAFLRQQVPSSLPNPLLDATGKFTLIEALVQRIASLIFTLPADTQTFAIENAIKQNIIGPHFKNEITKIVSALQKHRVTDTLARPYLVGKATLGSLLTLTGISKDKQQVFATALTQNTQSMTNFWKTLGDGTHGFTPEEASSIEQTLTIGALIKNHEPLLKLLLNQFNTGAVKNISDLARHSLKNWEDLVSQSGAPPAIDAAGTASPEETFAREIYVRVTRAYPTVALATRVVTGNLFPVSQQAPLNTFFSNNNTLNLTRHNVSAYLAQEGDKAFTGIPQEDRVTVISNVKRMQRVMYVTPEVDSAQTLLGLGIHSATQIAMMGRQNFFTNATEAGLTKSEANQIYNTSVQRYSGLIALYTQMNRDSMGIWPRAIGDKSGLNDPISNAVAKDQSLATLFGSQDYCATDDCTSILSPAAYLCDLLYWLRARMTGPKSALDILNLRRPDIGNLKLNCPNTDTPLPYIDLVNEILSDAISPPSDPNSTVNPPWKQTSDGKTAADLRAAPEYFNSDAFVVLYNADYPHSLPYSEGLDELRSYLQQSGITLWQLRKVLLPINPTLLDQVAVAAERFTMAPRAVDIITAPNFITSPVAWHTANPATDLSKVPAFMQAASITYDQLNELLQSAWVQGGLGISIQGINDLCDTSQETLAPFPLDAGFLDRAHRFLRVWRETNYQMWELDMLMQSVAVANGTFDQNGLVTLGAFQFLQDQTKLLTDAQLAWFQNMDIAVHLGPNNTKTVPLYSRVYLNPAIVSLHPDADLEAVVSGTPILDGNLNHHLDAIQSSLGISGSDAAALVTLFGLDSANTLNIQNLTLLYRITQLAIVAKISITDLQSVAGLINPADAGTPAAINDLFVSMAAASACLKTIKAIQQSGFSIDALMYLLAPPAAAAPFWIDATAMTDTAITTALATVRQAILNPSGGDINGSVMAAVASQLNIANDVTAYVMQNINLPGTANTLLVVLTDASITSPLGGPYLDLTRVNYPNQFYAMQLLDKIRVIIQKLHLVITDLTWLVSNASVYGGIDFINLPVMHSQAALSLNSLLNTVLLVKLARLFTSAPQASAIQTLYDIISGVHTGSIINEASAQADLSTITGWNITDIISFTTALGVTFSADYLLPKTYDSLRMLEAMIDATSDKASAAQLVMWAAVPTDESNAEDMAASALNVLKSRYSNPDWLTAAPDIINPLREHRSSALQDYLVGNGDHSGNLFADVNSLFDYFLIDTQMSSCEVTTRVIQAYIAVQIFVERCRMNLEAPAVIIDPNDDAWDWWSWMKRYRIWEAAREVFLYPENWLIESQRPTRTEIYKKLEKDVHQGEHTTDYFESVSLNYLDGLDGVADLHITGTCQDPADKTIHVVGRTHDKPPRFYHRQFHDGIWGGWIQVPLDIKSHHVVPAMYRNRLCLFWPMVKVHNEPQQNLPSAQPSGSPPSQDTSKYVSIELFFTIFRNGTWTPAQASKGTLFDIPLFSSSMVSDSRSVEAIYTIKVQSPTPSSHFGSSLFVDVFRLGDYQVSHDSGEFSDVFFISGVSPNSAVHVGRAVFDGRFSELELNNLGILVNSNGGHLLSHAQSAYGPDADPLLPLDTPDPDLIGEPNTIPKAGALVTVPADPTMGSSQTLQLNFNSIPLQQQAGILLNTAPVPFRVISPSSNLQFDPSGYFFYQDNHRCYYVDTQKWFWTGSMWAPVQPSNPSTAPFEVRYFFHRFYHPYVKLLWHQLGSLGFPGIYDPFLQQIPDQVDPSHADVFSFQSTYNPTIPFVKWGEDNEILDFSSDAAYSIYNWEIFYHIPLYTAGLLSQNQQFEDAMKWFHYIFDPTHQGSDSVPQRFWIPKPLHDLAGTDLTTQRINNILQLVNTGDPDALNQVKRWRDDPFNPFLLADLRPVAYMKTVVMQYLDNLIAWGDNLFATNSREALSEATLLYVIAAEILGPQPAAITPPMHADDSYNELAPKLDTFANAMVDIENVMGGGGGGMGGGGGQGMPGAQTFYFKIPPNAKLLGYWNTVADRLFKLRHCQNIQGGALELALFDAPIDPGLLVKAQAAGMDIGSVLSDLSAPLPNYRYMAMYSVAQDFVGAVRAYGSLLIGALEKSDAAALAVLQQTIALELQQDTDQIYQLQIEKIQHDIDALTQAKAIADSRFNFNNTQPYMNAAEYVDLGLNAAILAADVGAMVAELIAAGLHNIPSFALGVSGFGGTPNATAQEGGPNFGKSAEAAGQAGKTLAAIIEKSAFIARTQAGYQHRKDNWAQAANEAQILGRQMQASIDSNNVLLEIAQWNQINHQKQIDDIQKQIDFLNDKFTNQDLYDWQVGLLSDLYFQSYKLAYRLCKQVEKCYRYELGIQDSSFIQFGYWDSLHKGLLAGESLNHDLRRMHSSYLDQNVRRLEVSRFISLSTLDPVNFQTLIRTGVCDFDLPESLFDNDYPGHYNRHLVRMSVTVNYPSPGKFDNVKATLTLVSNRVRVSPSATSSSDYTEVGINDPRFIYNYAAVSQKIALGNAQDDPGLFLTSSISTNLSDQRYLPFEGAGVISSWHLEMNEASNEIDLSSVGDVVLHIYYTALYGGDTLKGYVKQNTIDNLPSTGVKVFSARTDFSALVPTDVDPDPLLPWDAFIYKPVAGGPDQSLAVSISALKFPTWTRGKTINITGITVLAIGWPTGDYILEPQGTLAQVPADMTMSPIAGSNEPKICSATLVVPPGLSTGKWTFKLKTAAAADFRSLTKDDIGDILFVISYSAT